VLPKLEKLALSDLPEGPLDRTIRLVQSINDLLQQAATDGERQNKSSAPQKTVKDKFSLINFTDDDELKIGMSPAPGDHIQLSDSPIFSNLIERIATFSGPGIIIEVYKKEDMTVLMLLNHAEQVIRKVILRLPEEKIIDFGIVQAMSAACKCSLLRCFDERPLGDCTLIYEGSNGLSCTVNLICQ
jgi:hypothetical protein